MINRNIAMEVYAMDLLKALWPLSFKVKEKDVTSLVVQLIVLIVVCAVAGVAIGLLVWIPIIGWIIGIVGSLVGLYCVIGIVLCILQFCAVLK